MNNKIHWITKTAVMLALLVALQAATKPLGQIVTGSFINGILAVTALSVGAYSAVTVALISPVLAYLLGIAPQILTVPAIMAANLVYVLIWHIAADKKLAGRIFVWLAAAAAKFAVLYTVVVRLICGVFAERLLASGTLKEPMLKVLPVTFSWTQLLTALLGGAAALLIVPILRKALRRDIS